MTADNAALPQPGSRRTWVDDELAPEMRAALTTLSGSRLGSLLLDVAEARAARRQPAQLMQQWIRDRFVAPAFVDQRKLHALDTQLFDAAAAFEAIELSPLAPLGACSALGPGSQNRIVSTMRGTEVVSDPTNALALECARRLRGDTDRPVRLCTSHRCVRAQPFPALPGYAAHFRLFGLASAGRERADHGYVVEAIVEQIGVHLSALDRLERIGYAFGKRRLRLLATPARRPLAERIATAERAFPGALTIEQAALEHAYYDGLRFMIDVEGTGGDPFPLIDGGAFDWLHALAANRRLVLVASAFGSQVAVYRYA